MAWALDRSRQGKEWRMGTVGPRLAAGLVAAGLVLSGCGESPSPSPAPKPSKSTSPSASPTPTPPVLPDAAKAKTRAGAEAFIRHYIKVLNYAGPRGETEDLRRLALATCVKCKALADGIDRVYANGGRITGGGWTLVGVKHFGFRERHYFLDARIDSAPQEMAEAAGSENQQFPGVKNRLRAFVLERVNGEWKVSELDPSA